LSSKAGKVILLLSGLLGTGPKRRGCSKDGDRSHRASGGYVLDGLVSEGFGLCGPELRFEMKEGYLEFDES
jgi:hypothetical protein